MRAVSEVDEELARPWVKLPSVRNGCSSKLGRILEERCGCRRSKAENHACMQARWLTAVGVLPACHRHCTSLCHQPVFSESSPINSHDESGCQCWCCMARLLFRRSNSRGGLSIFLDRWLPAASRRPPCKTCIRADKASACGICKLKFKGTSDSELRSSAQRGRTRIRCRAPRRSAAA